jgi:prepilin-type N-terminal cleavage/methylation domain-containing protein
VLRVLDIHREESGFTLLEMLVASVILIAVLSVAGYGIVSSLDSGFHASDVEQATSAASDNLDLLGEDLHQAMARDRRSDQGLTPDQMKDLIQTYDGFRNTGSGKKPVTDIRDVLVATPDTLIFRSNVIPEAPSQPVVVECVRYYLHPDWSLWRNVTTSAETFSGCNGWNPASEQEILPPVPASLQPATRGIFQYTVLASTASNDNSYLSCQQSQLPPGTSLPASGGGATVNNIVQVQVNVVAYHRSHDNAGQQNTTVSFDLRSRTNHDYLYALGCAA